MSKVNKIIRCGCSPSAVMYRDVTDDRGVRRIHGGLPACCIDSMCEPAAGEGFVILDRRGRQKRIRRWGLLQELPYLTGARSE